MARAGTTHRPPLNMSAPARGTMEMVVAPARRLALSRQTVLEDGARGSGERRGEATVRQYAGGEFYPACTLHGAMNAIGGGKWRCLAPGCNIGVERHG